MTNGNITSGIMGMMNVLITVAVAKGVLDATTGMMKTTKRYNVSVNNKKIGYSNTYKGATNLAENYVKKMLGR